MLSKVAIFALTVAIAQAWGNAGYSSFSYGVHDPNTGDVKDQRETRVGNKVVGQYSLLESDGTKRIVDYEANPHTGFNAVVRKQGLAVHPTTAAVSPSYIGSHASPVYSGYASPALYGQATPYATAASYGGYANSYSNLASPLAYGGYGGLASAGYGYGAGLGHGAGLGYGAGLAW